MLFYIFSNVFSRRDLLGKKGSLAEKGKIAGTSVEIESKGESWRGGGVSLSLFSL